MQHTYTTDDIDLCVESQINCLFKVLVAISQSISQVKFEDCIFFIWTLQIKGCIIYSIKKIKIRMHKLDCNFFIPLEMIMDWL